MFCWFSEFKHGHDTVIYNECTRRPANAVTEENVSAPERLIREDTQLTYDYIEGFSKIHLPSVLSISNAGML